MALLLAVRSMLADPAFWLTLCFDLTLVYSILFTLAYALCGVGGTLTGKTTRWRPGGEAIPFLFLFAGALWFTPLRTVVTSFFCGLFMTVTHASGLAGYEIGTLAATLWFGGFAYCLVRLACTVRGLVHAIDLFPEAPADAVFAEAAATAGLPAGIVVKEGAGDAAVASWGFGRRCLVVPAGFLAGHPPADRHATYLHELTHIGRRDSVRHLIAALLECCFWFQPAVLHALGAYRNHLEIACDRAVLARYGLSPVRYGQTLVKALAERHSLLVNFTRGGREMRTRLAYILEDASLLPPRKKVAWLAAACLAAFFLFLYVFDGAIGPDPSPDRWRRRDFTSFRWGGVLGQYTHNMKFE